MTWVRLWVRPMPMWCSRPAWRTVTTALSSMRSCRTRSWVRVCSGVGVALGRNHLWLETIVSPYRAVVPPLAHYLQALHNQRPDITLTVVLYELVAQHRWQQALHSQLGPRLRRALRPLPDIVLSTVPFHLFR